MGISGISQHFPYKISFKKMKRSRISKPLSMIMGEGYQSTLSFFFFFYTKFVVERGVRIHLTGTYTPKKQNPVFEIGNQTTIEKACTLSWGKKMLVYHHWFWQEGWPLWSNWKNRTAMALCDFLTALKPFHGQKPSYTFFTKNLPDIWSVLQNETVQSFLGMFLLLFFCTAGLYSPETHH